MRVVAGEFGGRRLKAPPGLDTRPTADRVREAVFSILGSVDGLRVADLYAGSGALGIEALSRGASTAVFVESDRAAADVIEQNLATLGATGGEVVRRDVLAWLGSAGERAFDLVFCDPPYDAAAEIAQPLTELLPRVAAPQALIVTESSKRNPLISTCRSSTSGPTAIPASRSTVTAKNGGTVVCPGSYDPVTMGHIDIIGRVSNVFDQVIVAVVNQPVRKQKTLFNAQERCEMIEAEIGNLPNVQVKSFDTLIVDFAREHGAKAIVKGLRAISDFEYEFEMNQLNRTMAPDIESIFMMSSPQFSFLSSSGVKELAMFGGDLTGLVPDAVAAQLQERLKR